MELTIQKCYDLLEDYKSPNIVVKHCEQTAKIAYIIAKKLAEKGYDVNVTRVVFASLLHDIFKIIEIKDYTKHNGSNEIKENKAFWDSLKKKFGDLKHQEAFALEFGKRYPKISKIVNSHLYSYINKGFESWEEKILFYADALVMFDKITTLKQRLDDVHKRYSSFYPQTKENLEYVEKTDKKIFELQDEIFKITGISPNELIELNDVKLMDLIKNG